MLNKLLKYDLKYMIKNMSVFYILGIIFAIITRILFSLEQTYMIKIMGQISLGCMFAMVANIIINVMMRSWVRFRDSIYKDESYLTHTLPVTKSEIYNSKFIQSLLFFVFSFIIAIIILFITYYTPERWDLLKNTIKGMTSGLEMNTYIFLIGALLMIFVEIFNAIQCGFIGIILGYKQNNYKVGYSVLFGMTAYFASQTIIVLLTLVVGLFNSDIMGLYKAGVELTPSTFKFLTLLALILYTMVIAIMNIVAKKIFNQGVNIE